MKQLQAEKMGSAPLLRLIINMSLPAMFSMLVQALYNVVDSIFVAQLHPDALTAISLAFPLQMLLPAIGVGTGIGINSLVARRLGEQRFDEANSAATHGIFLAIISWLVFVPIGLFVSRPFFAAFTQSTSVITYGTEYLSIVMCFSLGAFMHLNVDKTLQATGNMFHPMVSQLIGAVTNIILDPLFIFGYLGFPALGMQGAAVATVIGQFFSMFYSLYILFYKKHSVQIRLRRFRFQKKTIRDIYIVGIPSMVMQSISSVLTVGMNAILVTFSEAAVSVLGIYFKLQSFVFMPVFGLTQGVMPIMGYNYGARNTERLLQARRISRRIAIGIMLFGTLLFALFPTPFLTLFNPTEEILKIGAPALRIISLSFVGAAIGILNSTFFQALGKGFLSLIISVTRQLVVILPLAYVFSFISLDVVWIAFPISEIVAVLMSALMVRHLDRTALPKKNESTATEEQPKAAQ